MIEAHKEQYTFVLALFFFMASLLALGIAVRALLRERAVVNWPTASAVVVDSFVREKPLGETEARIVYRYVVDGEVYKSSQIRIRGISPEWRESAESLVGRFPLGTKVEVPYNPTNPADSYLVVGVTTMNYVAIGVSSVMAALLGLALLSDRLASRRKPPVLPALGGQ